MKEFPMKEILDATEYFYETTQYHNDDILKEQVRLLCKLSNKDYSSFYICYYLTGNLSSKQISFLIKLFLQYEIPTSYLLQLFNRREG